MRFAFAALGASGLAAATLGLASPALAVPSGPDSAQDTVNSLRANGYHVILSRVGAASLDQCTVTGVRKGSPPNVSPDASEDARVVYTTVYIDLKC